MGTTAATGLALTLLAFTPGSASAAVPQFPDNLVVFPDRDFVSIEGYSGHAGETALVEVTRPGVGVIGSAKGKVSGTDVAFEINHPGGLCWGAGTGLDVTPDIKAGDVVSITFPDGSHDETTTSSATVTKDMVQNGTTVTVEGTYGPDVNPDQMEQRIINAALVDVIGKRSISAVPGPLTPAPKGGYSSALEFPSPGNFVATYEFDTLEGATTAAAADLGERAMSWEVQDPDGNRQGLTIAEFGEVGGPGVGGCPAGPGQQGSPAGSASVVRSGTSALVKWTPVTAVPTADPVTGYSIEAVGAASGGQQTTQGLRVGEGVTNVTLTGLDAAATYSFEVRSMSGAKMGVPFTMGGGTAGDTTVPTLSLSPAPAAAGSPAVETNSVTVTSNGQVFYTTDGSPVISGDLPSDSAKLLVGSAIPITGPTTLKIAAFDQVGNFTVAEGDYTPVVVALPAKPTGLAGTQTQNSVALTWNAGDASVTGYQVTVYDAAGAKVATQPPVTTVPRQTVTGLNPGTTYGFTVAARSAAGLGPESDLLTKTTDAATDRITISTARWRTGDFRVTGTGDKLGAVIQLYRVNADGSIGAPIQGATAQVVAAAPPGIGDWDIRLRNAAAGSSSPGRIIAKSSAGGVAGPFVISS